MAPMWRSPLSAAGALLLWCASALALAAPLPADPAPAPPAVALGGEWGISLFGKSSYFIDEDAAMSVDQVEAAGDRLPWQVRHRDQHDRLQGRAVWLRFDAAVPTPEHWYLEVDASAYDKVQFFYRDRAGKWVTERAGNDRPVAQWAVPGRVPTFTLAVDNPHPVRYWLRIVDDRADFAAPLTLYREDTLQSKHDGEQFLFGAYFGLAGLIILAALANGLALRDRGFIAYGIYTCLMGAGQLASAGVGAQHIWREWPAWNGAALALWPGAATAAGVWFVKVVTEPARLSRALDLGAWALIAALLAAVAVDVFLGTPLSMNLVLVLTALSLLTMLWMALWGWIDGRDPTLRLVAIGLLPVLLMAVFPLARGFGLVPSNVLTRFGVFYGAMLELPLVYYALNMRLLARRQGDLRTGALARSDALTGLPDKQALVARLETSLAHARGQRYQCALLGVRIANFAAIGDEFGRQAADKALVVAASHLRRSMVNFDMAARIGEREFALLLEAPVTPEAALSRAQQLVAHGLRQMESLPAALTLKFHVTVAMLPDPQLDGAASLQWVVDALDQITPDARKLIRPLNFNTEKAAA